ncbi:MAG: DUF4886 domain-containing protein [Glaciecola sp.]|jgi:hypothetical protein
MNLYLNKSRSTVVVLLLLVLPCVSVAATTAPIQRALFVGNSFSYYNNGIQNHVSNLVRSAQQWEKGTTRYRMATVSGGNLSEHVASVSGLLDNQGYDALVIQGLSNGPIKNKKTHQRFSDNAAALIKLAREHGAQPILFMTWPYANTPKMTEPLLAAYAKVAQTHQVMLVPVGLAFATINTQYPNIDLYVPDISAFKIESHIKENDNNASTIDAAQILYKKDIKHPSIAGTYLAACMFYAAFYQQSPVGLAYTAGLSQEYAAILQHVAWDTLVSYSQNNKNMKTKKAQS